MKRIALLALAATLLAAPPTLIALRQIAGGASGTVPISNGTNLVSQALTGDASVTSGGVVTVSKINGNSVPTGVTTGDLLSGTASNTLSRLPVGSSNQVLTVSSGLPSWQSWSTGLPAATTPGRIPYDNGSSYSLTSAGDLIWDSANKRLGIGTASPNDKFQVGDGNTPSSAFTPGSAQSIINSKTSGSAYFVGNVASATFGDKTVIAGYRARGTLASPTSVSNGDQLLSIAGGGYDGTAMQVTAAMVFTADGPVSTGDMPERIDFFTSPTANGTLVNRGRFTSNGSFELGVGSALSTSATAGYLRVNTTAGVPAGVPEGGLGSVDYDTSDARWYGYSGSAWVNLSPAAPTRDTNVDNAVNTSAANTVTLTAANAGLWRATRTLGQNVTLPSANSVMAGTSFKIYTASTGGVTVSPSGSDTIDLVNTSTTIAASGHCKTFESDGVADWAIVSSI